MSAMADDAPIAPDRPGFSTGTYTVNPGQLFAEFGYQYAFNNHGINSATQTAPSLTLRTGLTSRLELDLLWSGWNIQHVDKQPSTTSTSDMSVGGKYSLTSSSKYHLSLLGLISLPVGGAASTTDHVDPLAGLLWDYSLSDQRALFGVVQVASTVAAVGRIYQSQIALGTSFSHTDRLGSFFEIYGILPNDGRIKDELVIDGGLTYLLNSDIQLDMSAGIALNKSSNNFVSVGIARRF